jgi:membrane-bound metal-dependent hydrolase YbcI (DUF457 family)
MDLFTHMLISYIITLYPGLLMGGISEPQLLFAVICGIFPDFDVLTFFLWKRYPRLMHHGVTHSLAFGIGCPVVLGSMGQLIFGIPALLLIPFGIVTCVTHVLLDLLTTYPVPLFAPASWRSYSIDIDLAVNPWIMLLSLVLMFVLWQLRAMSYPFEAYMLIMAYVTLIYVMYYCVKGAIKYTLQRGYSKMGEKIEAHPTRNVAKWYLSITNVFSGTKITEISLHNIGGGRGKTLFYEISGEWPENVPEPPIDSPEKALLLSAITVKRELEKVKGEKVQWRAPREELSATIVKKKGTWEVFWFDWYARYLRNAKGVLFKVTEKGEVEAGKEVRSIEW